VTNSLVQGNRADLGGGVYVDWYAVAALDGVQVVSNTGVITGGGVFLDTGLLTVTHSTIAENATAGEGGGFYSTGVDNSLTISATRILSNTAGNGGALFQADGATTVNASCIVANSDVAVYYDGGVAPPLDAKSNWWGHPTGPSGAGPGFGDSTSDNVDFDDFLGAAILDCPTFTFPDLVIAKSTAPYVLRGGVVTYTLAFSNSGDGPAANVVISDAIPLSITVTGVTSSTTGRRTRADQRRARPGVDARRTARGRAGGDHRHRRAGRGGAGRADDHQHGDDHGQRRGDAGRPQQRRRLHRGADERLPRAARRCAGWLGDHQRHAGSSHRLASQ
jgi:uncharacterized repeat protein (TIGR01451 family)